MSNDQQSLSALNVEINKAENDGDRDFLAGVLAPELAFSRANGDVDDGGRFLQRAAPKKDPGALDPKSIEVKLFGKRAIVLCEIVQGGKKYHNIRLFVRRGEDWKLLGWANEEVK